MFSKIFLFAHKQINMNLLLGKQCNSQSFLLNWNSPNCKYLGCSRYAWIASLQIQFSLVSNANVFLDNHNTQLERSLVICCLKTGMYFEAMSIGSIVIEWISWRVFGYVVPTMLYMVYVIWGTSLTITSLCSVRLYFNWYLYTVED
jgi:hypothetical protein